MLKDFKELWGIPIEDIKRDGKKYRIMTSLGYLLDCICMISTVCYLYTHDYSFNTYIFVLVFLTLSCFIVLKVLVNPEKWRAYLFYKRYKKCRVEKSTVYLKENNMESILYCSGFKRRKKDGTFSEYKELMLGACREDSVYSKRIGKLLYKFDTKEDNMKELNAYFLSKGRKKFLIGFDDEEC